MDLWQLKIFCKVIETESFSKAGAAIHLSQPTVSSHIKDLEDHFECRLLDRLGKKVTPTKAGELLHGYAKRLLSLVDETETSLHRFRGLEKGSLTIGGSSIPGSYILPRFMGVFLKKYPGIQVKLTISDTREIFNSLLEGDIEVAITGAESDDKSILQEKLLEDNMKVIVRGDHKWASLSSISFAALCKEPFIFREEGSGTGLSIKKSIQSAGFTPGDLTIIALMGNTAAVCQGIKNNVGISILSPLAVQEELEAGTLRALDIDKINLSRFFYLTWHKHKTPSPISTAFTDLIKTFALE